MEEQHHQHYFYIIPAELVESGDHYKALLFGLISSLADKKGYCWATSKYLAEKLGRKERARVSEKISELVQEGWLEREVIGNRRALRVLWTKASVLQKAQQCAPESTPACSTEQQSNIKRVNKKENKFGDLRDLYPTIDQIMQEKLKKTEKK